MRFVCTDFGCSRLPCCEFRLLPRKIPSSGILTAAVSRLASLPLPDRNGRDVSCRLGGTTHVSFCSVCRLHCRERILSRRTLYALHHIPPTKRQWHDVCTLPIIALKVLREVWRELLQKFPPSHPPRIPLPLFDGEAERAETATESEVVAVRVGKEVGVLQTELAVAVE